MSRRSIPLTLATVACLAACSGAFAQYDYGKSSRYGGGGDGGFFLMVQAGLVNPRNADNVVATEISGSSLTPIIPVWSEDLAGRIGFGYGWENGNSLMLSYWTYETDVQTVEGPGSGGTLAFAIGPPVASGGDFFGDAGSPGVLDITTEITAETLDVAWSHEQPLSDAFSMIWSVGLRYANFEETHAGTYDEASTFAGANSFAVFKSNQGEMIGARIAARGAYRFGAFSIGSGVGLSLLDGELDAFSSLDPNGTSNGSLPTSAASFFDDGRSGSIRDFEVEAAWHLAGDRLRLSVGWEQSEWRDIAADLLRNFPGTITPLRDREAVLVSGARVGLRYSF